MAESAEAGTRILLHEIERLPDGLRGGVAAIGNFDGVHLGHRAVLSQALEIARTENRPAIVLTFEPHPRTFFRPETPVFRLADAGQKAELLVQMGFDCVVEQRFDEGFSRISASQFIEELLAGKMGVAHVVTGEDFHFGHKRQGTPEFLRESTAHLGMGVTQVEPQRDASGEVISSSRIRDALARGDVFTANTLLGRPFAVAGEVIKGKQLGRQLGFPTANLALSPESRLRHGIYAVRMRRADGSRHHGVASFGRRPTFDNGAVLLETFVFDFSADLYGENIEIEFFEFLRGEAKFDSADELVEQMHRDADAARAALREHG